MELSELERALVEAAVAQRVAYLALDRLAVQGLEEPYRTYLERRDPVKGRWERALVEQQLAADKVIASRKDAEAQRTAKGLNG